MILILISSSSHPHLILISSSSHPHLILISSSSHSHLILISSSSHPHFVNVVLLTSSITMNISFSPSILPPLILRFPHSLLLSPLLLLPSLTSPHHPPPLPSLFLPPHPHNHLLIFVSLNIILILHHYHLLLSIPPSLR